MKEGKKALQAAFPLTVPVMMGYLFIGVAYGVLMAHSGRPLIWTLLMSMFVYAGSMQFVAVNFFTGPVSWLTVVFMTLMVNVRHLFYGISMLDKFRDMGRKKPYMIFSLTDETFSLLCSASAPEGVNRTLFLFFLSLLDQLYWIAGSLLGGLVGAVVPFNTKGIDFAMTALFVVIFTQQWESCKGKSHFSALTGLFVSILCLAVFGPSNFILPSMIGILLLLTASYRLKKPEKGDGGDA